METTWLRFDKTHALLALTLQTHTVFVNIAQSTHMENKFGFGSVGVT